MTFLYDLEESCTRTMGYRPIDVVDHWSSRSQTPMLIHAAMYHLNLHMILYRTSEGKALVNYVAGVYPSDAMHKAHQEIPLSEFFSKESRLPNVLWENISGLLQREGNWIFTADRKGRFPVSQLVIPDCTFQELALRLSD